MHIRGLGHVRFPYFEVGEKVWIDGKRPGKVEHLIESDPERVVVELDHGFFAHDENTVGRGGSDCKVPGSNVFISSMVIHVSNLATSEFGDQPYKEVE